MSQKTFNVKLKKQSFNASVSATILHSNECYKGTYYTVADLENVNAFDGDYADVFEGNVRYEYHNGVWSPTTRTIPVNPLVVKQDETSIYAIPDTLVRRDETAGIIIENPTLDMHATTKHYVDAQDAKLDSRLASVEYDIANPILVITKIS